jgi:hypothetical protein
MALLFFSYEKHNFVSIVKFDFLNPHGGYEKYVRCSGSEMLVFKNFLTDRPQIFDHLTDSTTELAELNSIYVFNDIYLFGEVLD